MRNCPICDGKEGEVIHTQRLVVMDDYPLPSGFEIILCPSCGMVFNRTSATQEDYNKFYTEFSVHQNPAEATDGEIPVWEVARLRDAAKFVADCAISKDCRILDVGCSSGGLLRNLASLGFRNLAGVDPSPVAVENVKSKGIAAYQGGAGDLPDGIGPFDLITLTGVLEHIQDVKEAIASLVNVCSSRGRIFLEVPDAERYGEFLHSPFQDFNTEHINHFSSHSLQNLMMQFGFSLFREEHTIIKGASGLEFPGLGAAFERVTEVPVKQQWKTSEKFRQSIQRYIHDSHLMIEHLNLQIQNVLSAAPEVIIWGTGQLTMKLLSDTVLKDANIIAFIDGNPIHCGKRISGIPILRPDDIPSEDAPIIVSSLLHAEGILARIHSLRIGNPVVTLKATAAV